MNESRGRFKTDETVFLGIAHEINDYKRKK